MTFTIAQFPLFSATASFSIASWFAGAMLEPLALVLGRSFGSAAEADWASWHLVKPNMVTLGHCKSAPNEFVGQNTYDCSLKLDLKLYFNKQTVLCAKLIIPVRILHHNSQHIPRVSLPCRLNQLEFEPYFRLLLAQNVFVFSWASLRLVFLNKLDIAPV